MAETEQFADIFSAVIDLRLLDQLVARFQQQGVIAWVPEWLGVIN